MTKPVLVVVHQETSTWGKLGQFLLSRGIELDRRCPCIGDTLPPTLDGYLACVIFGGPQSANDNDRGIKDELNWLQDCGLHSAKPMVGICLGAQLIAKALGAKVGPHPDGRVEIGYTEVRPTAQAGAFLHQPTTFYQWHGETFEIPADAIHLAQNDAFPGQAFCYRESVFAIEFHPEMTRDMVFEWSTSEDGSQKLVLPGAQGHAQQMAGYDRHSAASDDWLNHFIDNIFLTNWTAEQGQAAE